MIHVAREDIITMLEAGYMCLAMKNFKKARQIFEGVCTLVPKHDVPQVALANVYFAQHKFLDSVRILKNTVKEKPDSAFAYSYLGESQLFYGKKEEAVRCLEKASQIEPQGKSGDFARSLLKLISDGYDPVKLKKAYEQKVKELKKSPNP